MKDEEYDEQWLLVGRRRRETTPDETSHLGKWDVCEEREEILEVDGGRHLADPGVGGG